SLGSCRWDCESVRQRTVVDPRGKSFSHGIQVPLPGGMGGAGNDAIEQTRKMLLERLGVDLAQTNMPVEMLVIKKASGGNPGASADLPVRIAVKEFRAIPRIQAPKSPVPPASKP